MRMLHIFIGYDAREDLAYRVAENSIRRHCSVPCVISPLKLKSLTPLYTRKHRVEGAQRIDEIDGKPFSTDFSFTRFLVPHIARRNGVTSRIVFVDCDFLFLSDIAKMVDLCDPAVAVSVVKHNFTPKDTLKMDGVQQTQYNRKLWSSLMVMDPTHPDCLSLTPDIVNTATGIHLHSFQWASVIGEIDETWNWLPRHSPTTRYSWESPKAIHYTDGGPWFPAYRDIPYASEWQRELDLVLHQTNHWKHQVDFLK